MQSLKRFFVVPYLLACLLAGAQSLWHLLADDRLSLAWLGAAIGVLPILGFMIYLAVSGCARTSLYMPVQLLGAFAGASLAVFAMQPLLPVFYALVLGLGGVLAYVFWYSDLGRSHNDKLRVGAPLPAFTLEDVNGNSVPSSDFLGRKVLFLFYRGNWCPLCMAQVREVAEHYRELSARGVKLVMVSPQSHDNTRKLAERFEVPLQFYVDRDNRAARALDILHEGGVAMGLPGYGKDTVYPTVIIVDEGGRIVFADLTDNYRLRPEPRAFLDVLDGAPAM